MNCLYSLKDVWLSYPVINTSTADESKPVQALKNLTLDIYENEYLAVLGANGCGKSSLARLLTGLVQNTSGEISYKGNIARRISRELLKDTALVLQEPQNQLLMPTVAKELSFPLENRGYKHSTIESRVAEIAELFGLTQLLSAKTDELSGGQITSLAIASALICEPDTIILDEPDSHLDHKTMNIFTEFINRIRGQKTIVMITQFPESIKDADRVLILNNGELSAEGKPEKILSDSSVLERNNLENQLSLSDLSAKVNLVNQNIDAQTDSDSVLVSLENVSFSYNNDKNIIKNMNLNLRRNDRLAIIGPSGSGKTTLGLLMAGLLKPQSGTIVFDGKTSDKLTSESLRRLITIAVQFPERALFEQTVADDIAFGPINLSYNNTHGITEKYSSDFGIDQLLKRHPFSLSGGEKRKTALAGIFAMESKIVILDEPSAALDPKSSETLIKYLHSQADKTLVIISHDLHFISQTCSRIVGVRDGTILFDLPSNEFYSGDLIQTQLTVKNT